MNHTDVLDCLDDLIRSRSILEHPFYVAWENGELSRDQLATYATVYYPHVAAFPSYLKSTVAGTDDPAIRRELEENLADELGNPKPHAELWADFAEELGVARASLTVPAAARPAASVETFKRLASDSTASGLAALYAYESQQPEVSRRKIDGLREHYGVTSPSGLAYFEVHAEADVQHRRGEREALSRSLDAGADPETIQRAAREALDAYWGLLDEVCERAGIGQAA